MAAVSATLDACVLVPAALRDALLYTAAAGMYQPRWSASIIAEVERTLVHHRMASPAQAAALMSKMRMHFPDAWVFGYERLIASMTNHPKDRHIVAATVAAGASIIVTSNLRDFPAEALAPYGIEAQSPDGFLVDLFDRDPALVVRLVQHQAASLTRPPQPFAHVLRRLSQQAPMFAEQLQLAVREADYG